MTRQSSIKSNIKPAGVLVVSCLLTSCANFDHDNSLRFWERSRINAEQALKKNHLPDAHAQAEEAVDYARSFGNTDFRLGVSLCELGDVLKAQGKYQESEKTYKEAISILKSAEKKALDEVTGSEKAGNRAERESKGIFLYLTKEDLANTLAHLGDLYALQAQNQHASDYFEKASETYESMIDSDQWSAEDSPLVQELVSCLIGFAQVSTSLNKLDVADEAYKKALEFAVTSNSPEYLLREIRDAYLQVAQQLGRTKEASRLVADTEYTRLSLEGMDAVDQKDFARAEVLLKEAYQNAKDSIFSKRRMMRALFNLQTVYRYENKYGPTEETFNAASAIMHYYRLHFDRDFDLMLSFQAGYYLSSLRAKQALEILKEQYKYRLNFYGQTSLQVCETVAMEGEAELQCENQKAAEEDADIAYKIIKTKYMTNRRAGEAMKHTAKLMQDLNHFEESEFLNKLAAEVDLKFKEPTDPQVIGYKAKLFAFYWNFHKMDKAKEVVNEIVATLQKAPAQQRAAAMPYLVLIQSYALTLQWWDLAEQITILGQSILKNDCAAAPMDAMNQSNWTKDIAKLEAQTGRKF